MARLDRAIHENTCETKVYVDGRVKPDHDNEGRCRFLHMLIRGNDIPLSRTSLHRLLFTFRSELSLKSTRASLDVLSPLRKTR